MRVSQTLILLPVFAQVLLTFAVLIAMAVARQSSLKKNGQSVQDAALATDVFWDDPARRCSNNYKNQFELPVLFYAVCAFALITRMVDIWFLVLAAAFAVSRIAHAVLHIRSNAVPNRAAAFLAGFVILVVLWVMLFVRMVAAGF
ncbi:MAG: MAPEG family protein [Pseudomonadota bacterium]